MSQTEIELVRRLFEAFNRQDLQAQLDLLSDDYAWRPAFTGGGLVEGNAYRGREGYARYWDEQRETWARIHLDVEEFRDLGDRVLVLARIHAVGRSSGVTVDQPFGGIWAVRGGELVEGTAYRTSDDALRAASEPR